MLQLFDKYNTLAHSYPHTDDLKMVYIGLFIPIVLLY